jgi:hypothetical protein
MPRNQGAIAAILNAVAVEIPQYGGNILESCITMIKINAPSKALVTIPNVNVCHSYVNDLVNFFNILRIPKFYNGYSAKSMVDQPNANKTFPGTGCWPHVSAR